MDDPGPVPFVQGSGTGIVCVLRTGQQYAGKVDEYKTNGEVPAQRHQQQNREPAYYGTDVRDEQ